MVAVVTAGLSAEQSAVVSLPVTALALVTAGPGAGKTHTTIARLRRLADAEDLGPADVLVLSFSRSATRELGERLVGSPSRPRVRTFDAWALELLMDVRPGADWISTTFDKRIAAATDAVSQGELDERFEDLRHVMIDEVQDLVGSRARLVMALLDRYDCGFTLVGDAAQSVYDFQREETDDALDFASWVKDEFAGELVELELTENFRAETPETRLALPLGDPLRGGRHSGPRVYEDLRGELLAATELGSLSDPFTLAVLTGFDGSSAFLARTNGIALEISGELHRGGVPHRLQRGAQDRSNPAWMCALFGPVAAGTLTRAGFDELVDSPGDGEQHERRWEVLRRSAGRGPSIVDTSTLSQLIREGRFPDELLPRPVAGMTASSFHRAKGLEFDRVVVVDPGPPWPGEHQDLSGEARALFVAMTRGRSEMLRLPPYGKLQLRKDPSTARWVRTGNKKGQRFGMELLGRDVDRRQPPGTAQLNADAEAVQDRLRTVVTPGDPVTLRRLSDGSLDAGLSPHYAVIDHDQGVLGIVSDVFRAGLLRVLGGGNPRYVPRRYPAELSGLWVDSVETVGGSEASGEVAGLGPWGVWLAPRLVGLSRFHWNESENRNA